MATLKDVAQASGLTVGTVSRVLNNRGYISDKTRQRVYKAMKDLNYQPNEMARSLSKQKNNTIGVILPHLEHPYFARLLTFLERAARKQGYRVTLFNSREDEEREEECIEACRSSRVAGVVLCSGSFETEKFKGLGFPLVTIERSMDEGAAGVECDSYQGGVLATEHLIKKGCKNLLYIGGASAGENVFMPGDLRETAFRDTCRRHQMDGIVVNTDKDLFEMMEYYEVVYQALKEHPETDGVFASADVIGAYVLQACADLSIRVPDQLKLVGFDDIYVAQLTTPKLTTIHQPVKQMAEAAISTIAQLDAGLVVPTKTVFPVTLIERGTT